MYPWYYMNSGVRSRLKSSTTSYCVTHMQRDIPTHMPRDILTHLPRSIPTHMPRGILTHMERGILTHMERGILIVNFLCVSDRR